MAKKKEKGILVWVIGSIDGDVEVEMSPSKRKPKVREYSNGDLGMQDINSTSLCLKSLVRAGLDRKNKELRQVRVIVEEL